MTLRPIGRAWWWPAGLFALPLLAALALALGAALDVAAWRSLLADPALWPALSLMPSACTAASAVTDSCSNWSSEHTVGLLVLC